MKFSDNPIEQKSFEFALMTIEKYKQMCGQQEYVISKQLLRSGTSVGANIQEAQAAISKRDFTSKMSISSKEAREARYWLLLSKYGKLTNLDFDNLIEKCEELIKILTSIVKTSQAKTNN